MTGEDHEMNENMIVVFLDHSFLKESRGSIDYSLFERRQNSSSKKENDIWCHMTYGTINCKKTVARRLGQNVLCCGISLSPLSLKMSIFSGRRCIGILLTSSSSSCFFHIDISTRRYRPSLPDAMECQTKPWRDLAPSILRGFLPLRNCRIIDERSRALLSYRSHCFLSTDRPTDRLITYVIQSLPLYYSTVAS